MRPQIVSVVRADGKDMALPLEKKRILPEWMIKTAKAAQPPTNKTSKNTQATKPQHAGVSASSYSLQPFTNKYIQAMQLYLQSDLPLCLQPPTNKTTQTHKLQAENKHAGVSTSFIIVYRKQMTFSQSLPMKG